MDEAERVAAAALAAARARAEVVEGGEAVEVADVLVSLTNLPAAELNGTWVARDPADPAGSLVAAREVFRSRGHPFFGIEVEVGRHPAVEDAIRDAALRLVDRRPAMALALPDLEDAPDPTGVEVREALVPSDLDGVRSVETVVFGTPPEIAERFIGRRMLRDPRVRILLARVGDRTIGEAAAYLLGDTVGIFGVGVVDAERGRGVGATLTRRAATAFGDRADLAWLQPSERARPMYERLGFRAVSDWEVWVAA
ncbi:MAG TPA: GNAT family N-acetyltransferase [Actinomycetota bacterium]